MKLFGQDCRTCQASIVPKGTTACRKVATRYKLTILLLHDSIEKSRILNWLSLGNLELYLFLPVENFPSHFGEFSNGAAMPFNRHEELGMDIPHFSRGSFSHYPNAPCHRLNDFSKTVLKYNTHKNTYTNTNKNTNTNTIPSTTASIFQ